MSASKDNSTAPGVGYWSRYWAAASPHSLSGSFDQGYGGAISAFWNGVAEALPPRASVLDLATGNAPLPRLLLEHRPDLLIHAVDAADITLTWRPSPPAAAPVIHARVSCEHLPFADADFDLVSSQYGIEYSDLDRSIAEVSRVLRPGGRFAAVIHTRDSRISGVTADELGHVEVLLAPAAALDAVAALAPFMAMAGTEEGRQELDSLPSARVARNQFNAIAVALKQRSDHALAPDILRDFLQWAPQVFSHARQTGTAQPALQSCQQYRQQLADAKERYRSQQAAALDQKGQMRLLELMESQGLNLESRQILIHDGHELGMALTATRG
ncbi:MAG: class I SAM-dependent methyltransferase [Stenotrophomonas nitritireducens]|nr:class I SAM-dependent methyltransferase [Stenotrophomonas nitritireducens]